MMRSPRTIQIVVVICIVLLVGFLFTRDIKGLEAKKEVEVSSEMAQDAPTATLSLTDASATAKNLIM